MTLFTISYRGKKWSSYSLSALVRTINLTIDDPKYHLKTNLMCALSLGKYVGKFSKGATVQREEGKDFDYQPGITWVDSIAPSAKRSNAKRRRLAQALPEKQS